MVALPQLARDSIWFPDPSQALQEPNGLLAFGGDLSAPRLLAAYRSGIFPWYQAGQPILWWSPDPRAVLDPAAVHLSRSLRRTLRRGHFRVTFDTAFAEVIRCCALPTAARGDTWITPAMQNAYVALHELGYAHSVECWQDGQLVGGLYGVALGGIFFGESMFARVSDASKVALAHLCARHRDLGFVMIDCQVGNPHTFSMGARELRRDDFITLLETLTTEPSGAPPRRWRPVEEDLQLP